MKQIVLLGLSLFCTVLLFGCLNQSSQTANLNQTYSQDAPLPNQANSPGEQNVRGISSPEPENSQNVSIQSQEIQQQDGRPVLQNLGVNIDAWNRQTNMAGDLIFTPQLLFDDGRVSNEKVFIDFGSPDGRGSESKNIEIWWFVPLHTKIRAPVSGFVTTPFFNHTQDWGINIMATREGSQWIVSFEHMVNLEVNDGDYVNAGDVVGEAAPRITFNNQIAMVELAVWQGGPHIIKYCPFSFLNESLKPLYAEKLNALARDWEEFSGRNAYQQENWVEPGCLMYNITET